MNTAVYSIIILYDTFKYMIFSIKYIISNVKQLYLHDTYNYIQNIIIKIQISLVPALTNLLTSYFPML